MPVTEVINTKRGSIMCWTITESVIELKRICSERGVETINTFTNEARFKQSMATLILHSTIFGNSTLGYLSTGKPIIEGGQHISISHSGDKIVMMKSDIACGVDIERIHPRVEKVKHKFLNDQELITFADATTATLTQLWTAKEAMFKVHGTDTVFMRSNIFVDIESPELAHAVLKDGTLELRRNILFRVHEDMMLAWTEIADEN